MIRRKRMLTRQTFTDVSALLDAAYRKKNIFEALALTNEELEWLTQGLFNLPIDYVKLDGSIVARLDHPKMSDMAGSIVQMCHKIGMEVIAEYVKDAQTVTQVKAIGVDMMQGYAYGEPSPILD